MFNLPISFMITALIFILTPGLDTVFILRTSATGGYKAGFGAILGISLGVMSWGIASSLGLTAIIAASQWCFFMIKLCGALYLAYLGIHLIVHPRKDLFNQKKNKIEETDYSFLMSFKQGLMTNLLNPKVGLFFMTFFPQFIPASVNITLYTFYLTFIQIILNIAWFSCLVLATIPLGNLLRKSAFVTWFDRISGLVFMGFGIKLFVMEK